MKKDHHPGCRCSQGSHGTQSGREGRGVTRRGFLTSVGVGAVGVAASGTVLAKTTGETQKMLPEEMLTITLNINARNHNLLVEPRWTLLHVLRERIGLTGAKEGCGRGECGACTVLIDDIPRYACLTLAVEAEGRRITTIEGLMDGEQLGPVQEAFLEEDAYQCGYCTPGQILSAEGLLRADPDPSPETITRSMSGNLCRCGTYPHIHKAIQSAARKRS